MKLRHTLVLFLVLIVLSGLYYGMQVFQLHREHEARAARRLFQFTPEDIQRMTIERIDGPACIAERANDKGWRILEPNPTITPFHRMWDRVAGALSILMNEHTVLPRLDDPAPYGLDMPALRVSWKLRDGAQHELQFGDLEPTQRHRYARLDDGALFLVNADAFFELNRSLLDLRHRFLVADRESPLHEIEFAWIWTGGDDSETEDAPAVGEESVAIKVTRASVGAPWRMTAPVEAPANHEAVQALSDDVQFAVSEEFVDAPEDLADYGLRPPRARISVRDAASGDKQTIWIGAVDASPDRKGLFVRREGEDAVRVLDGHLLTLLPRGPLEWRDLRLLTRRVTDINRLEYHGRDDAFVLEKTSEGGWRLAAPEFDHINDFAVSGYLRFFKEVQGEAFVEEADPQQHFETPDARIKLRYDDGATAEIVVASRQDDSEGYWAMQDTGAVVKLSDSVARMLRATSDAFRSREIMRFIKADVEALRFSFEDTDYHLALRHGKWALLAPETMALHNQADVDMLMDAVTPLHAVGVAADVAPDNLDGYGLDAPVFQIAIQLAADSARSDQKSLTLAIGNPNPENPSERFAKTSLRAGVFLISQEAMDEIREALRGIR